MRRSLYAEPVRCARTGACNISPCAPPARAMFYSSRSASADADSHRTLLFMEAPEFSVIFGHPARIRRANRSSKLFEIITLQDSWSQTPYNQNVAKKRGGGGSPSFSKKMALHPGGFAPPQHVARIVSRP